MFRNTMKPEKICRTSQTASYNTDAPFWRWWFFDDRRLAKVFTTSMVRKLSLGTVRLVADITAKGYDTSASDLTRTCAQAGSNNNSSGLVPFGVVLSKVWHER